MCMATMALSLLMLSLTVISDLAVIVGLCCMLATLKRKQLVQIGDLHLMAGGAFVYWWMFSK